jgi:uncharacterized protein
MILQTWISSKAKKGLPSKIHGLGIFAVEPIKKGEVIAARAGYLVDTAGLEKVRALDPERKRIIWMPIDDNLFLAPGEESDISKFLIYLNHSCEPNVGPRGDITFEALYDVDAGEELTLDMAMTDTVSFTMECHCQTPNCRKVITGEDWKRKDLQEKYGRHFSPYILEKIYGLDYKIVAS